MAANSTQRAFEVFMGVFALVVTVGFIGAVGYGLVQDIPRHRKQLQDIEYRLSPEGRAETNHRLIEQCKFEGGAPIVWFDSGEYRRCEGLPGRAYGR